MGRNCASSVDTVPPCEGPQHRYSVLSDFSQPVLVLYIAIYNILYLQSPTTLCENHPLHSPRPQGAIFLSLQSRPLSTPSHPLLPRLQYVSDPINASDRPPFSESETRHTLNFHTHSHHNLPPLPSRHHSPIRTLHRIVASGHPSHIPKIKSVPQPQSKSRTRILRSRASAAYVPRGFFHRAH